MAGNPLNYPKGTAMPNKTHLQEAREYAESIEDASLSDAAYLAAVGLFYATLHQIEQTERRDALVRDTLTKVFLLFGLNDEAQPARSAVAGCDECGALYAHTGIDSGGTPMKPGAFAGDCPECGANLRFVGVKPNSAGIGDNTGTATRTDASS